MGLEDLEKVLKKTLQEGQSSSDIEDNKEDEEDNKKQFYSYDNYSKKRVTLIGYLIGVKEEFLLKAPFNQEYLKEINEDKNLNIIRALCSLRSSFLHKYDKIYKLKAEQGPFVQFEDMGDMLDVESLKFLNTQQIEALQTGVSPKEFYKHIANLNQLIEERIDYIHQMIPEWVEWEYVKNIFIMPGCSAGSNGANFKKNLNKIDKLIHKARTSFYANIDCYPYHIYINLDAKRMGDKGNILLSDYKFFTALYEANGDTFKGIAYVIDAKCETKDLIYDFLEDAENIAIFVDCENISPYKFASVFKNLEESKINKIQYIKLFDDEHTSNAWDMLKDEVEIQIEHEEVVRIKEDKSLVDHALSINVTKAVYGEGITDVIIASSDSDFWSLINYLPNTRFFVMNERERTSPVVIEKLDEYKISHCYMNEFAQDSIQQYKNRVIMKNLKQEINNFNENGTVGSLYIDEILEMIFQKSGVEGTYKQLEIEKQDFYNKYLKKLRLEIVEDEDGRKRFELTL